MSLQSRKRKSSTCVEDSETIQHLHTPKRPDPSGTFQKDIEDLRNLIYCGVCVRPLYEPFTLGCGHTFCYGIRNIVQIFISRPELLEKNETTAEHMTNQLQETERIDSDKKNADPETGGLFQGCFKNIVIPGMPIRDLADGVDRCPECAWELEDGDCIRCGYARDGWGDEDDYHGSDDYFDSDDESAIMEIFRETGYAPPFDNEDLIMMRGLEDGYDTDSLHVPSFGSIRTASEDEDTGNVSTSDDMGSFIDDEGVDENAQQSDTATSTVVGNHDYLTDNSIRSPATRSYGGLSEVDDSVSEGMSEHGFYGLDHNPTVINLDDDDDADDDVDDDDDEPIRTAVMASRRKRQLSVSTVSSTHTSAPLTQMTRSPSIQDSSSDAPHGPVRRRQRRGELNRVSP
ncbi:E3 ubiquitin ligase [Emydomyces testavorans]|uniref:E3 ubiquitin ligase n=1 Tax=Emydomyces testavorans TaxID=2070801 RepID=A0AAF0DQT2_9EURO|nr:E3 ubiquitin ligase [Emydomyces testavorans]